MAWYSGTWADLLSLLNRVSVTGSYTSTASLIVATGTFGTAADASVNGSTQIPAGAYVIGVTTRVTTTYDGAATSLLIGWGSDTNAWGNNIVKTAGTLTTPADWTVLPFIAANYFAAATDMVLTGVGGDLGDVTPAGGCNYAIYYMTFASPAAA